MTLTNIRENAMWCRKSGSLEGGESKNILFSILEQLNGQNVLPFFFFFFKLLTSILQGKFPSRRLLY